MRRLAALIIGVTTAQPVQNYYGNADPHHEATPPRETGARLVDRGDHGAAPLRGRRHGRHVHEPDELLLRPRAPERLRLDDQVVPRNTRPVDEVERRRGVVQLLSSSISYPRA